MRIQTNEQPHSATHEPWDSSHVQQALTHTYTGHACKHAQWNATMSVCTWKMELLSIFEKCLKILNIV